MKVTCCKLGASPVDVTCGLGVSCAAQCKASEGSLCPSGNCNNCLSFEEQEEEGRKRCTACGASSNLKWCKRKGCKVKKNPICCFHPDCRKKRPGQCAWLSYYLGSLTPFQFPSLQFSHRNIMPQTWKDPKRSVNLYCSTAPHS